MLRILNVLYISNDINYGVYMGGPATKVMVLRHQNDSDNVPGHIYMHFYHSNRCRMFPGGFQTA